MNRREFAKMALGAAATGVLAGKVLLADDKPRWTSTSARG